MAPGKIEGRCRDDGTTDAESARHNASCNAGKRRQNITKNTWVHEIV